MRLVFKLMIISFPIQIYLLSWIWRFYFWHTEKVYRLEFCWNEFQDYQKHRTTEISLYKFKVYKKCIEDAKSGKIHNKDYD